MAEPVWCSLLSRAFELIDQAERSVDEPIEWSFGGGTVLMLRMNRRHSKDVDIFLADQQVLGFFNPLPNDPFESTTLLDRAVILERSSEIISKEMWHRGNQATARDLFDFAAVYVHDPGAIEEASPFLARHAHAFLQQISAR